MILEMRDKRVEIRDLFLANETLCSNSSFRGSKRALAIQNTFEKNDIKLSLEGENKREGEGIRSKSSSLIQTLSRAEKKSPLLKGNGCFSNQWDFKNSLTSHLFSLISKVLPLTTARVGGFC